MWSDHDRSEDSDSPRYLVLSTLLRSTPPIDKTRGGIERCLFQEKQMQQHLGMLKLRWLASDSCHGVCLARAHEGQSQMLCTCLEKLRKLHYRGRVIDTSHYFRRVGASTWA